MKRTVLLDVEDAEGFNVRCHNLGADSGKTKPLDLRGWGEMMNREMMEEYRRMNSVDRSAFDRWLITNTVFGAIALVALIAVTSIYSGKDTDRVAVQESGTIQHAEAK